LVGIAAAARQLGVFADSLTNVQNRIRLVTKDTAQLNAVTKKLFDIAARTRTGFSATATIFSRTALAVKDLGLSLQETLDFTEALNQAIVLSGVKAQEANAGLIQLSQGLASGTLRGDELRSVLEQLPKVADLIAGELGVLRGELRILGEQGKITTADIIKAFTGLAAADLAKAFAESLPTMSQGLSVLTTKTIEFVGQLDDVHDISGVIARTLIRLAFNLETVGKAALVAGAALVGPFAKAGVLFATRAVKALTLAILANPIGALIAIALAAVTAIIQFGDSLSVSEDGLVSLKDVALATWQFILDGIQPVVDTITEGFKIAINFVISSFDTLNITFSDVLAFVKTFVNTFLGFFSGLGKAIASIFKDVKAIFNDVLGADLKKIIDSVITFATNGLRLVGAIARGVLKDLKAISGGISKITGDIDIDPADGGFLDTFANVGKNAKDAFVKGFNTDFVGEITAAVAPGLQKISESARQISAARQGPAATADDQGIGDKGVEKDVLPFALQEQLRLLEAEGKTLRENNRERGIQSELLELEEKLRSSNVSLNENTRALLETEVRRLTGLREQADVLDGLKGPQEEITRRQAILNELYGEGEIGLAQFNTEMENLGIAQAKLNIEQGEGSFFDGFLVGMEDNLESVRNFTSEAGMLFDEFFDGISTGFADSIASAIVFGDSLKESIGNVARQDRG
jgi:tape measure domain-containing protein